jgi:hypothetical protein
LLASPRFEDGGIDVAKLLALLQGDPFSFVLLLLLIGLTIAAAVVAVVYGLFSLRERLAEGPRRTSATRRHRI